MQRIVYFGTPSVAVPSLRALHAAGFDIPLVISGVDKRRGRGKALHPSPVKEAALELGLDVSAEIDDCLDVHADLGVVVAYGRIIAPHVLDLLPMVNLHFSLLPRWRGAAPVERAILAGDAETGVCLMALADGLDEGDIYRQVTVPISDDATLDGLRDELVDIGSTVLVDALGEGLGEPTPQVGETTYARKIASDERAIDWSLPAQQVRRVVALGGAHTTFRGRRFKIWSAALAPDCAFDVAPGSIVVDDESRVLVVAAQGCLELLEVQIEGKPRQSVDGWRNGARLTHEDRLGE